MQSRLVSSKSLASVECWDGYEKEMQYGDLVMVYLNPNDIRHVYLEPGGAIENKYGKFEHASVVGHPFGREIRNKDGYISVLAPSAELWSSSLRHRTQIVQPQDCAIIVFELGLKPGQIVFEAGTGSGALSTALARAVAPSGKVHSFEFNKTRVDTAIDEFEANRLDSCIRVYHRDICEDGFPLNMKCDALFLDVPEPWLALPHALKVLKPGAKFASYSPCLEQVQKVSAALTQIGAIDLRTVEVRQRDFELRQRPFPAFAPSTPTELQDDTQPPKKKSRLLDDASSIPQPQIDDPSYTCVKPIASMRGHTAFLTFALIPTDLTSPLDDGFHDAKNDEQ